jgi:adenosine deaminase
LSRLGGEVIRPDRAASGGRERAQSPLSVELIRRAPKVLLHDHMDGGLRPATVIELARAIDYRGLPTDDPDELGRWFTRGADQKSLELYLEAITSAVAVIQTPDAIARVAAECTEDLAAYGIVYAEVRFAPELFTERRLPLDEIMAAAWSGFEEGMRRADAAGHPIVVRILVTAMRQARRSTEIAELTIRCRDAGVVGFDLAGPEAGYPPTAHLEAFRLLQRANVRITVHAGEAVGLPSIHDALELCGAERLGHGVRIVDDITLDDDGRHVLGRLASYVRDRRIALEICPTSNVHTGAAASIAEHPFDILSQLGFCVTVNTDDRLLSDVSLSGEFGVLADAFRIDLDDMERMTLDAMTSSFLPYDQRVALISGVIEPGYARLRAEAGAAAQPVRRRP